MIGKILCMLDILPVHWDEKKEFDYNGTLTETGIELSDDKSRVQKVYFLPDVLKGKHGWEIYQPQQEGWQATFRNESVSAEQSSEIEALVKEQFPGHADKIRLEKPNKE